MTTAPISEDSDKINIKVKQLNASNFELDISKNATVDELKENIKELKNFSVDRQRVIFRGRVLKSGKTLDSYSITDQSTIHLIIRKNAVSQPTNDEPTTNNSTSSSNRTVFGMFALHTNIHVQGLFIMNSSTGHHG